MNLESIPKVKYWIRDLKRLLHSYRCHNILKTRPILGKKDSNVIIVTLLQHCDLIMYLVAIKSLCRFINFETVHLIDDGTLTTNDRRILNQHIMPLQIYNAHDINTGKCPTGSCWERLIHIIDTSHQRFVIQLDADTITLHRPAEVIECIHQNRAFTLGTEHGTSLENVYSTSARVSGSKSTHVQTVSEKHLTQLPCSNELKYVRGCAGFAGFSCGFFSKNQLESFSTQMEKLIGAKWYEWGSEQVASNYVIANSPDAYVLPIDRYCNWYDGINTEHAVFIHFIGGTKMRYRRGIYTHFSLQVINQLLHNLT